MTNDKFILDIVSHGYEIEFESEPCEECNRKPINFNLKEQDIITSLLNKFENKGVVVKTEHEKGEILSNIFIRPKADGSYRLILNLSRLNEHVDKITFKMETLKSALQMISKGCYFAKIDLKDAFYSISINDAYRKYLKFEWQGKLYQFTCLPNGLRTASRIFTKALKPVLLNVRLACDHLFGKLLFTWLSLVMSMMVSFVLSFFPRDVLDEILNLVESVSEDFPSYFCCAAKIGTF